MRVLQLKVDMLWFQIELQFAAIIRAKTVMWVKDADVHSKEESGGSESYKIAFAYEKFESFIKAQSKAMSELRGLIKQFEEMRLKLQLIIY